MIQQVKGGIPRRQARGGVTKNGDETRMRNLGDDWKNIVKAKGHRRDELQNEEA